MATLTRWMLLIAATVMIGGCNAPRSPVALDELPAPVRENFAIMYPGAKMLSATKEVTSDPVRYRVTFETAGVTLYKDFWPNGRLARERAMLGDD